MSANKLLPLLEYVKQTGTGRYLARCPAHDDRLPSLAIRELSDGRILIHCFAGCTTHEIVSAVGLDLTALFPKRAIPYGRPERRPFPADDVLCAVAFESLVVSIAASALSSGKPFSETDRVRLLLASSRIQAALNASGLQHG